MLGHSSVRTSGSVAKIPSSPVQPERVSVRDGALPESETAHVIVSNDGLLDAPVTLRAIVADDARTTVPVSRAQGDVASTNP